MQRRKQNKIVTDETGTYLELKSKKLGSFRAYFDYEDIEKVDQYTWGLRRSRTRRKADNIEVVSRVKSGQATIFLHNVVFPVEKPLVVDHINNSVRDCRKSNLRAVTPQQNQFNRDAKGYSWCADTNSFRARIVLNGKFICLGYHQTEEVARAAYLAAKEKLHII